MEVNPSDVDALLTKLKAIDEGIMCYEPHIAQKAVNEAIATIERLTAILAMSNDVVNELSKRVSEAEKALAKSRQAIGCIFQ